MEKMDIMHCWIKIRKHLRSKHGYTDFPPLNIDHPAKDTVSCYIFNKDKDIPWGIHISTRAIRILKLFHSTSYKLLINKILESGVSETDNNLVTFLLLHELRHHQKFIEATTIHGISLREYIRTNNEEMKILAKILKRVPPSKWEVVYRQLPKEKDADDYAAKIMAEMVAGGLIK